jgi:hypothetical protein
MAKLRPVGARIPKTASLFDTSTMPMCTVARDRGPCARVVTGMASGDQARLSGRWLLLLPSRLPSEIPFRNYAAYTAVRGMRTAGGLASSCTVPRADGRL